MSVILKVIGTSEKGDRVLQLVKISIPLMSSSNRTKLLNKLILEYDLDYFIEVWDNGSILMKPKNEFYGIFAYRLPENNEILGARNL